MENKKEKGFLKWFFTRKWIGIPFWILLVLGSFGNSGRLLTANPNYPLGGVIFDALGGIVFAMIVCAFWYLLVTKRKVKNN